MTTPRTPSRSDSFFNPAPTPDPTPVTRGVRSKPDPTMKFRIERRLVQTRSSPQWQTCLGQESLTMAEGLRRLTACGNSPLRSYWWCEFRLIRISSHAIVRTNKHKSIVKQYPPDSTPSSQ